jgi:hypothetical protein
MRLSRGDPVEPATQADQRASGPEDVPDAVQQPTPTAQRPGVSQMPDRLLHQRAQLCLHAVKRPLPIGEAVLGPPVPDRRMPVLAGLCHAPEPPVQQACGSSGSQHLAKP